MEAIELLAILILAGAVVVLIYYYVQNNSETLTKVKTYIPNITPEGNVSERASIGENKVEENSENTSVGDKLKVRFKDIDMPTLNTDSFSKKIDTFLDGKSDELIQDWSLATKNDIDELEKRCEVAYNNIDDLEKRFKEFKNYTNEKIDNLDERLKKLEDEDLEE
jgi:flagellar motility protein MotE (MotC chaperone)